MAIRRVRATVWHPHQKLWNRRLVRALRRMPLGGLLERAVIVVDSVLLVGRSLRAGVRHNVSESRVLYLDCGLHTEGRQVRTVSEWLEPRVGHLDIVGFEAGPHHVRAARRSLSDVSNLQIHAVALVGPDHADSTVRLYRDAAAGRGDSLFAGRGQAFDDVPAARLSSYLPPVGSYDAVILRMNIEGAESFVIDDLIDADAIDCITGYYGMWDDLSKIDPEADLRFRQTLTEYGIATMTFNDRDYVLRLRLWAIRNHILGTIGSAN